MTATQNRPRSQVTRELELMRAMCADDTLLASEAKTAPVVAQRDAEPVREEKVPSRDPERN